tara:strand:- start:46 stop:261 length:216 start_codon:yes stop_codon:yes gene_type:complete
LKRCDEYRLLRIQLGTQGEVAPLLGITVNALSDREMGHTDDIREESFLALQLLIAIRKPKGTTKPGRIRMV